MFKRILFATNFSPHADEIAKRFAMRLAQPEEQASLMSPR